MFTAIILIAFGVFTVGMGLFCWSLCAIAARSDRAIERYVEGEEAYCPNCDCWLVDSDDGRCPDCGKRAPWSYADIQGAKTDEAYDRLKGK